MSKIDPAITEKTKLKSECKIVFRTQVDHFCANEKIVAVSVEHKEEIRIYSLETEQKVAVFTAYQPDFAIARFNDCVNYWFDIFSHQGKTYLAILEGPLRIWKIEDHRAHLASNHSRSDLVELVNEFQIQPSCRITVKAENGILAISLNDVNDPSHANNSVYAIPFDVLVGKRKFGITDSEEEDGYIVINPICVFEDMITSGISVSKSRIALLHCNGAISDLVSKSAFIV